MNAPFIPSCRAILFGLAVVSAARAQVPAGAQVVQGDVAISQAGGAMTLTQASRHAIVNWQSFNLGADASLRLHQPGADAAMLARVVGGDPSTLLGSLEADGKLFLVNPKGVVVGPGAVIDTAAFLASTLDVSDDDFLRGGALTFKGDRAAGVVNLGRITAREGNVLLLAPMVKNAGEIDAANGTAGLGAGTEVYLASPDAPMFVIRTNLSAAAEKTGVDNSGVIAAAQAQLEAAGGSLYELAVNQRGVVRATGSAVRAGRVLLTAGGGTVGVSGKIAARNADGSGGEILVGGDYRGGNAAVANAARTVVTATATLDASAAPPGSALQPFGSSAFPSAGRVIVWADDATRFLGTLRATGAGGGFAEVSGRRWLDFDPASAVQLGAGGTLLLDPDALVIDAGADSGTSTSGADPFIFGAATEPATLNVTTLQNQLAVSNVILDTSTSAGDVTFDRAVTWATDHALTVRAGGDINLNADLTGGAASTLALHPGRRAAAAPESGLSDINGEAYLAGGATITVGTLIYGANAASAPGPSYTLESPAGVGPLYLDGNLHVGTLELDLSAGDAGVTTLGADNAIGAFRATGNGMLSAYVVDHHGGLDVTFDATTAEGGYLQFVTPGDLTLASGSSLDFDASGTVLLASTGGAFVNQAGASVFGANARFLIYSSTTGATTKGGLTGAEVFNHPFDELDDYSGDTTSRFFFTALSGSPVLTYTADSFVRTYGAANPAFTFTRSGLVGGVADDVTGAPALSATATQSSGVGSYAINISSGTLASSNYDFSFAPGTLTIDAAPLTVTANDKTRRINLANPAFDATFSGFVLGENASALGGTLAFATPATPASPAGTYAITPSGLTSSNYAISFVPGTLTLTETSALLISANSFTRAYGSANPTFTASYSGFVDGDDASIVTGLQFGTLATQASGIGAYAITPFGASAPGYDISYANGTLTIERAPLTISVPNQSRLYGDANNLTVNYNGLVNGDTPAVINSLSVTSPATATSSVGTYAIAAAGAAADNYSITYATGTLSVTAAPLTVSIDAAARHYGDPDPAFTYTVGGLKNGDGDAIVSVHSLASLATADAGIGAYGIVGFPFVSSSNYTVPAQVTGTLTVTPRPLTITADSFSRAYGEANPAFTATFTGLAPFDPPALFGSLALTTQATPSSGVGAWGITFATVNHPNYAITPQFGTLTITPAPLTFGPLRELSRVYGRANPALNPPAVGGLKNGDTLAGLGLQFSGVPALNADAGAYTYTIGGTNPNYSFAAAPTAAFTVTPAPLTVAIGSSGRVYGEANPTGYDLVVTGLAFNDTAASVIGVANPTEARTDIGTYLLTPVLNSRNYVIESLTGGAFVISPRLLTFTAADRTKVYGDVNPAFFGTITGFVDGDSELNIVTNYGFFTVAGPSSPVGTYTIRPNAQTTTPNYVATFVDGTLTVTRAPLSIMIADAARGYGQANPVFGVAGTQGLKNQDTPASLGLSLTSTATPASALGTYPITGTASTPNYDITWIPGTLTIERGSGSVVDLNQQLDLSRLTTLNHGTNQINPGVTITQDKEIKVETQEKLTLAVNREVPFDTTPFTKSDFANYFASFAGQTDTLKAAMQGKYGDFLAGQGNSGSAYENMSEAARRMLADWMSGALTTDALQAHIASGDVDASAALGFILPTLVDFTRAKQIEDLTPMDREVLGRLADLTEKRKSDTLRIAQRKYDEMVETNARRAELNGLAMLALGPGDFQSIVEGATQEALGTYVGATLGAGTGSTAALAVILSLDVVLKAVFPASMPYVLSSTAAAGPAIVVANMMVLAVRAVQIGESVKNEKGFNDLMNSWPLGRQITSLADLKSPAMDQDMKLSTVMLAAELLQPGP